MALDDLVRTLNEDDALWQHFLRDPHRIAAQAGISGSAREALCRVARLAGWRAPYVPGWPISRLRPGATRTADILREQALTLTETGAGAPAVTAAPGGCLLAPDWRDRLSLMPDLPPADALIIVPPWGDVNRPSLAAHTLQAVARAQGHRVHVLYANVLLAAVMGLKEYQTVAFAPQAALLGEGLFSGAAYGLSSLTQRGGAILDSFLRQTSSKMKVPVERADIAGFEAALPHWIGALAQAIGARYRIVGATSTFEQTSASVALLNAIKAAAPQTLTLIGGANCDGEMAQGIRSLGGDIDYIFSGESEDAFTAFLEAARDGKTPEGPIIRGTPLRSLEAVPTLDYADFYAQRARHLPIPPDDAGNVWLSYETSRGCWWGETRHCKFCGLNGTTMSMRQKSPAKVQQELREMLPRHPSPSVWMADNIMPFSYYRDLLPDLAADMPPLHIYWDQKSNLSLRKMAALKAASVHVIQPGVEALSSGILKLMDKGVKAHQNIATLRYGRALDVWITWNILFDLPGDLPEHYTEQIALMPFLHHLGPPTWLARINIDRFSPYFFNAAANGITDLAPFPAYAYTFPPDCDLPRLAYHFVGRYRKASDEAPHLLDALADGFDLWRALWTGAQPAPALCVVPAGGGDYLLLDTRPISAGRLACLSHREARAALAGAPLHRMPQDLVAWGLSRRIALVLDDRYVPLAVADPDILASFETEAAGGEMEDAVRLQPHVAALGPPGEG